MGKLTLIKATIIMKIQFAFLSLFLATAHAGHESKGLRGRADDDHDQELLDLGYTAVPELSSARINCSEGSQCCVIGDFIGTVNLGYSAIGGGGCPRGTTYNNAKLIRCKEPSSCSISCDGTCNVVVKAGSGAAGGSGGWDGNGGMPGMPSYNGGGYGNIPAPGGMSGEPGLPGSVNGMPSNNRGNTLGPYYNGGGITGNGSPYYTPGYSGGYPGGNRGGMSGPYYNGGGSPQYQPLNGGPQYQPRYGGSPPYPGIHRKSGYSRGRGSGGAGTRINQGETCFASDII